MASPLNDADVASGSEKNANLPPSTNPPSSAPALTPKARSCIVCRTRKVRCDKQSPCATCRRANIACVFPSTNRPPRWARRLERLANDAGGPNAPTAQDANSDVGRVMERVRNLENLVKELSGQLEQARAAASTVGGDSPKSSAQLHDGEYRPREISPAGDTGGVQKQIGRLVLQDAGRSRYLDGLEVNTRSAAGDESDSLEDEASPRKTASTYELERTPSERHAFLFRHNLSAPAPELHEFHPLPSQIPFLLDVFSENVNFIVQIVHLPTITKMIRGLRGSEMTRLTPANEALMFSIYYAAITSMEEDDIIANFGSSKTDLNLKYRLGLEHALAKADFLNTPSIVLVQAFALFLLLGRRHDSPRFVWMMTGLVIRMAQSLGLQRDGAQFEHLTLFEIEYRRRVWWGICMLDLRASEDQGTELTIADGSFDTKLPLSISDADFGPETKELPPERDGVPGMPLARICELSRQMMIPGLKDGAASLEEQNRLLNEIYQKFAQGGFQCTTGMGNIVYWVGVTIAHLVVAKMTLIHFLPVLFSSPSEHMGETKTKLLIAAIEVAEYNHELNAEQACKQWRWVYQTYTHWYAIVYLLIEISRRPWSSLVERSWVALHSTWLIPPQSLMNQNLRIWFPLRKLMAKARKHREAEMKRLQADPQAAARLEIENDSFPLPSSSGPFPAGSSADVFRERWRQLVALPQGLRVGIQSLGVPAVGNTDPSVSPSHTSQPIAQSIPAYSPVDPGSNIDFEPMYLGTNGQQFGPNAKNFNPDGLEPTIMTNAPGESSLGQSVDPSYDAFPAIHTDWSDAHAMGPGFDPFIWGDTDPSLDLFSNLNDGSFDVNMDSGSEVNWYNWVESAKGMEADAGLGGNGWT